MAVASDRLRSDRYWSDPAFVLAGARGGSMSLMCRFLSHKPDKTRVWNDNIDFRAPCIRCGALMIRDEQKDWRLYDPARDDMPARKQSRHG